MAFFLKFVSRMRNTLTIGLIMIHLFAHTEAGQVFRLPNLLTHFFQHHRQNPSIDFFQYIAMHYGGDDGTHADDDKDDQLPCHNPHNNTLSIVYPAIENEIPSFAINIPLASGYGSILKSGIPSKHVFRLLQPPRA